MIKRGTERPSFKVNVLAVHINKAEGSTLVEQSAWVNRPGSLQDSRYSIRAVRD